MSATKKSNGAGIFSHFTDWLQKSGDKWYKHWIIKNIICACSTLLIILVIFFSMLGLITRHNKELAVPDFTNKNINEALDIADKMQLRLEVVDSIYLPQMKPGMVFRQNPYPGSKVKKNRRILLSINSKRPKMINMPSVVGFFLRQAHSVLSSNSLKVGKLIYVPDIASNNVLEQLYKGNIISPGRKIEGESEIDLKLGLSESDNTTYVPNLIQLQYSLIKDVLVDNSLNLGRAVFDRNVRNYIDSLNAVVYRQEPEPSNTTVSLGTPVTVYLKKVNETK